MDVVQGEWQSLREMLISQSLLPCQYLPEILDWNEGQYAPYRVTDSAYVANAHLIHSIPSTEMLFDFRETGSGGSLLSAYVDPYLDCYSLRLLDGRTMSHACTSTDTTGEIAATASAPQRSQICIDLKPLSTRGRKYGTEDITGLTFVGENTVATSHVSLFRKNVIMNVIKFWDTRMIHSTNTRPATTAVVASFPFDDCHGVESLMEAAVGGTDCFGPSTLLVDPSDTDNIPSASFAVSRVTGSVDNGRLSIATQVLCGDDRSNGVYDLEKHQFSETLVDTNRFKILHRTRKLSSDRLLKPAFTRDLNFMAAYGGRDAEGSSVLLYDLSKNGTTHQRKRSFHHMTENAENADEYVVGEINGIVNDSYGTESELLCLALNRHGTALLGGSSDGDLFFWG